MNRRRAADGLSFGVAYTYSDSRNLGTIDPYVTDNRARNYTLNGSRPHNLVINYSYEIPNLSQKWDNVLVKALADNWQVSGITSILSGTKQGFWYGYTNVPTGVLSGTGGDRRRREPARHPLRSQHLTWRSQLRQAVRHVVYRAPVRREPAGECDRRPVPGTGLLELGLFVLQSRADGRNRRLQFRIELYNAFDTNQWTATDTSAIFDYVTGAQTDGNFGKLTGATLSSRRIQLGARFTF